MNDVSVFVSTHRVEYSGGALKRVDTPKKCHCNSSHSYHPSTLQVQHGLLCLCVEFFPNTPWCCNLLLGVITAKSTCNVVDHSPFYLTLNITSVIIPFDAHVPYITPVLCSLMLTEKFFHNEVTSFYPFYHGLMGTLMGKLQYNTKEPHTLNWKPHELSSYYLLLMHAWTKHVLCGILGLLNELQNKHPSGQMYTTNVIL